MIVEKDYWMIVEKDRLKDNKVDEKVSERSNKIF